MKVKLLAKDGTDAWFVEPHHQAQFPDDYSVVYCRSCCVAYGLDLRYTRKYLWEYLRRIGALKNMPRKSETKKFQFYFTVVEGAACCGRGRLLLDAHAVCATQLK